MKYLDEFKKLNLPKDKFAIFGSGPLAIRNLRENKDIDIIVKQDLWIDLTKKYEIINEKGGLIRIGHIEIYKEWPPFGNLNNLIDDADIINKFPFVKLKHVLRWKKFINREKDQKDIRLIENYFKSQL